MELKIPKDRAAQLGLKKLEQFGVNEGSWSWKHMARIDLRELDKLQRKKLRELLEENKDVHGVKMMLYDMRCYERSLEDVAGVKVRNISVFATMLQRYLMPVPRHHVYMKLDDGGEETWVAYYVDQIRFHPKVVTRDSVIPAKVTMEILWEQFGGHHSKTFTWDNSDVRDEYVPAILAASEIYPETPDRRAVYEQEVKRYGEVVKQIGKQFLCAGHATDDCDGNKNSNGYRWSRNTFNMEREDGPSRVVIDVFREDETKDHDEKETIHYDFWDHVIKPKEEKEDEDTEEEKSLKQEEAEFENPTAQQIVEIPIHPLCVVFDLRRHLRVKTHLNNLTEYKYDSKLADKLILPAESKHLVELLIEHQDGGFKDLVKGKGGGAVVLLSGPPGTGKTLTAEIYAESEEKALYSVQASQLGTNEEALETELLKVLARARRWGAVMLLDEADVYVHQRGNDLRQNAIVGVFLRVLEYHAAILFLTTNRPEDVDDAIASRCIARINYQVPSGEDQQKIWRVLADASTINLADVTIKEITKKNPRLSGRDVKNLLKLAQLFVRGKGKKQITPDIIEFVKQFKPTCDGAEVRAENRYSAEVKG